MLKNRVIPVLLLNNGELVKTRKFSSPKYVGDPLNAIKIFNEKEVDELVVLDIGATKSGSGPDYGLIEEIASECFMPLGYGGGIRTVEQARAILASGVEKIILQTSIIENVNLISELAGRFGSQSIVASIDIKRTWRNKTRVWSYSKKKFLKEDLVNVAKKYIDAGVGEILLNSVDRDGAQCGYDLDLISELSSEVNVPIVACGGAGCMEDLKLAVVSGASAAAAGSIFVFQGPYRAVLISYPNYFDLESLFQDTINE